MRKLFNKLVKWYRHDRFKIQHLQTMLIEDHRWMVHNSIAKKLSERYLKAISEDWHLTSFEHASELREQLNCNPYNKTSYAIDLMKDKNINLSNILYESLNDNQKRTFIQGIRVAYDLTNTEIANMLQIDRCDILTLFINEDA